MAKYKQGQVVWGGRLCYGEEFVTGSAVVKSCGEAQVKLEDHGGMAFDCRRTVPVDDVYPSEFDALMALSEKANGEISQADERLKSERRRKSAIVSAMAELAKKGQGSVA